MICSARKPYLRRDEYPVVHIMHLIARYDSLNLQPIHEVSDWAGIFRAPGYVRLRHRNRLDHLRFRGLRSSRGTEQREDEIEFFHQNSIFALTMMRSPVTTAAAVKVQVVVVEPDCTKVSAVVVMSFAEQSHPCRAVEPGVRTIEQAPVVVEVNWKADAPPAPVMVPQLDPVVEGTEPTAVVYPVRLIDAMVEPARLNPPNWLIEKLQPVP